MQNKEYDIFQIEYNSYENQRRNIRSYEIRQALLAVLANYKKEVFKGVIPSSRQLSSPSHQQYKKSVKLIFKYASHVQSFANTSKFNEKLAILSSLSELLQEKEHSEILATYNQVAKEIDWQAAESLFTSQPDLRYAGNQQGLLYSYLKPNTEVIRRDRPLGTGSYGRTKLGIARSPHTPSIAIKMQKYRTFSKFNELKKQELAAQLLENAKSEVAALAVAGTISEPEKASRLEYIRSFEKVKSFKNSAEQLIAILNEFDWLKRMQIESEANLDLRVATSPLIVRRASPLFVYKVYQSMYNLGINALEFFQKYKSSTLDRLDYCIDAILITRALHSGKASISGKVYAHRDIKPQNFLISTLGELRLIDFSFTTYKELEKPHVARSGTLAYLPISFDKKNPPKQETETLYNSIEETPSYFFDDKVAVKKTIYNPINRTGFLDTDEYYQLPKHLQELIETHDIPRCISLDNLHSLDYIAAAFIHFRNHLNTSATDLEPSEQIRIIEEYELARNRVLGADEETLKQLILNREVKIRDLPRGYKIDCNLRPKFLMFLIEQDLLSIEQKASVARNLVNIIKNSELDAHILNAIISNNDIMRIFFRDNSESKINDFAQIIISKELLEKSDWTNLCLQAFAHLKFSYQILNKADYNTVMTTLIQNSLTTEDNYAGHKQRHFCYEICNIQIHINLSRDSVLKILKAELNQIINYFARAKLNKSEFKILINLTSIHQEALKLINNEVTTDETSHEYMHAITVFSFYVLLKLQVNSYLNNKNRADNFFRACNLINLEFGNDLENHLKRNFKNIQEQVHISNEHLAQVRVSQIGVFGIAIDQSVYQAEADNPELIPGLNQRLQRSL